MCPKLSGGGPATGHSRKLQPSVRPSSVNKFTSGSALGVPD